MPKPFIADVKQMFLKYQNHRDRINLNENWVASPDCATKKAKLLMFTNKVLIDNNRKIKAN